MTSAQGRGSAAAETYIQLLARVGRVQQAIAATLDLIPAGSRTMGIAPTLLDLSQQADDYSPLMKACRQRDDLLGFATGLVHQSQ